MTCLVNCYFYEYIFRSTYFKELKHSVLIAENWVALNMLWLCRITLPRNRLPRSRHDLDYNVWPKLIRENKLRVGLESHSMVARLCLPKADWHFDSFIVHYQNPKRMRLHMLYDDNQTRVNEMLLQHSKITLGCVKKQWNWFIFFAKCTMLQKLSKCEIKAWIS